MHQLEERVIADGFPKTIEEASELFENAASSDPFPDIVPALLNSADIFDYVRKTGLIFPFVNENLKSASYAVRIGQRIIYWDENGNRVDRKLKYFEMFRLARNSIVFVETEEFFNLPDYIAMRFNLKINSVHRGLLLGTGPLVDPGFRGNLFIPLHNMTTNDYYYHRGENFVWAEFTKLSHNSRWTSSNLPGFDRVGQYIEFPKHKQFMTPEQYLADAHGGEIRSSIPEAIEEVKQIANEAVILSRKSETFSMTAGIGVFLGILAFFVTMILGYMDFIGRQDGFSERIDAVVERLSDLERLLNLPSEKTTE